ncbi:MAG TPA: hypothetical protein VGN79_01300 [Devosia sp.]|jgi:CRISPR/Cas system-associated endoribonuclease Cas2|nr:hypothetical protein [Devosia sp.]
MPSLPTTRPTLGTILTGTSNLYVVSYDLRVWGQDYPNLIAQLEQFGALRVQQSLWWVTSYHSAASLRDQLMTYMDGNDSLMVGLLSDVAGYEGRADVRAWIEVYLRRHAA